MVPDTIDSQKAMKSMIELDQAKVIFPTSFGYFEPHMIRLAGQFPKVKFIHCGGLYDPKVHPANVGTYFGFIDECEYISGIVAAHSTRSRNSGSWPARRFPKCGVTSTLSPWGRRSVDPAITCTVVFTGDWSLPIKEAETTISLIDKGVDVMTCHVNSPKVVVENAERRGIAVCGYHFDQASLAPKGYLTGAEWAWEKIYTDYVRKAVPISRSCPACRFRSRPMNCGSPSATTSPDRARRWPIRRSSASCRSGSPWPSRKAATTCRCRSRRGLIRPIGGVERKFIVVNGCW